MRVLTMFVDLVFLASTVLASSSPSPSPSPSSSKPYLQIHPLRQKSGSGSHGASLQGITCSSWRLGVEAHNIIDWTVPQECEGYVGNYMLGFQYRQDSKVVARDAYVYAKTLNLIGDGTDIWVFHIDETSLSNLPYYAQHGFGRVKPFNETSFNKRAELEVASVLPENKLYEKLVSLGIKILFITRRSESIRESTARNLKLVGYHTWEKLILKDATFSGKTSVEFKSTQSMKLEERGYRIVGNIGDQWSDILGTNTGNRTFKLPDPMYYIS